MPSGVWAVVWALGIIIKRDLTVLASVASPLPCPKNPNITQICVYHHHQVLRS